MLNLAIQAPCARGTHIGVPNRGPSRDLGEVRFVSGPVRRSRLDGRKTFVRPTAAWSHKAGEHIRYRGIEVEDALEIAEQTDV